MTDGISEYMKTYLQRRDALIKAEKKELVSNCCSSMVVTNNGIDFTCNFCQEPCSAIDLNKINEK